jgi:hypothetical protein
MFDHVMLNVLDRKESTKLYSKILKTLGVGVQLNSEPYTAYGKKGAYLFWLKSAHRKKVTQKCIWPSPPSREKS